MRWIGQTGLVKPGGPVRHPVKLERIRTVMQELMYLASRMGESGRRLKLRFSCNCPGVDIFNDLSKSLAVAWGFRDESNINKPTCLQQAFFYRTTAYRARALVETRLQKREFFIDRRI